MSAVKHKYLRLLITLIYSLALSGIITTGVYLHCHNTDNQAEEELGDGCLTHYYTIRVSFDAPENLQEVIKNVHENGDESWRLNSKSMLQYSENELAKYSTMEELTSEQETRVSYADSFRTSTNEKVITIFSGIYEVVFVLQFTSQYNCELKGLGIFFGADRSYCSSLEEKAVLVGNYRPALIRLFAKVNKHELKSDKRIRDCLSAISKPDAKIFEFEIYRSKAKQGQLMVLRKDELLFPVTYSRSIGTIYEKYSPNYFSLSDDLWGEAFSLYGYYWIETLIGKEKLEKMIQDRPTEF